MSNPVDEALEMKKEAFLGGLLGAAKQVGKGAGRDAMTEVGRGALQAAGGAAVIGLTGAAMKAVNAIRKKKDFRQMMDSNSDLQEFQREDPRQFNRHYNSLAGMNPEFAHDPVVSGTYMRQMSMSPQTAGSTLVQSLESRQKTSPWQMGISAAKGPEVKYSF
jgi:hypothetical protein